MTTVLHIKGKFVLNPKLKKEDLTKVQKNELNFWLKKNKLIKTKIKK